MGTLTTIKVKEDGLPIKISIKDWIESDFARSLESEEDFEKWGLFEVIDSVLSYENYECDPELIIHGGNQLEVKNHVYAIGSEGLQTDRLKKIMGKTLISLRDSAIALKLEGRKIGEGQLVVQDRLGVIINRDGDYDDLSGDGETTVFKRSSKYRALWYGAIARLPSEYNHNPHEASEEVVNGA